MATEIMMRHKASGLMKSGYYGFSWTTFFFAGFPALFRKDFLTFIGSLPVLVVLGISTAGVGAFIAMLIWAFMYNSYYTKRLLERGYEFCGTPAENEKAASALGVSIRPAEVNNEIRPNVSVKDLTPPKIAVEKKTLDNDAYKIFLVKKYKIEHNTVLNKYIVDDALFDTVDEALAAARVKDVEEDQKNSVRSKKWSVAEAVQYLESQGYQIKSDNSSHKVSFDKSTYYFNSDEKLIDYAQSIKYQE